MSVKAGYRHLLRTCRQAFQADKAALNVAVQEIRTQVYSKADAHNPDQIQALIAQFYEASEFLTHNIVQGTLTDQGNYEIQPTPPQDKGQGPFKMTLQTPEDAAAAAETAAELDGRSEQSTLHSSGVEVTTSRASKDSEHSER